ncbi:MAG: LysM peptidoglycan-binding domain-containing protein [Solirubrobacterales bacterium]|nr:LysM peptidoglycan-binding domain-containing protein [Solirubrobacterales bacterium]
MKKANRYLARLLAAFALVAAVVAVVVIVSAGLNEDSSSSKGKHSGTAAKEQPQHHRTKAATYEVKTGDTLTAIAHQTGVPVSEILALNPEVDPQILIAGQKLKLK